MTAITGNTEEDFKDQNPIIANLGAFKNIYTKHKKEEASKKCWSMFMMEEPNTEFNPLARIPDRDERLEEIKIYYPQFTIESEEYKDLANYYSRFVLSKEQNLFKIHNDKLEELTAFLKRLDLDVDSDYKKYIDIMSKLPTIWKSFEQIKKDMIENQSKSRVRGNAKISKRDQKFK